MRNVITPALVGILGAFVFLICFTSPILALLFVGAGVIGDFIVYGKE